LARHPHPPTTSPIHPTTRRTTTTTTICTHTQHTRRISETESPMHILETLILHIRMRIPSLPRSRNRVLRRYRLLRQLLLLLQLRLRL
jgi:hypothetical protein